MRVLARRLRQPTENGVRQQHAEQFARHVGGKASDAGAARSSGRGVATANVAPAADKPITVRILLSRDKCIIEQDGVVVWSGEHQLSQDKPRRFGVRLLARNNANSADVAIRSIRLMKP